jgi:hypothetical protein
MDNFGYRRIHIPEEFHRRFERLLEGGIWAIVDIEYRRGDEGEDGSPFHISGSSRSSWRGSISRNTVAAVRGSRQMSGSTFCCARQDSNRRVSKSG